MKVVVYNKDLKPGQQVPEAMLYVSKGHASGKVLITCANNVRE